MMEVLYLMLRYFSGVKIVVAELFADLWGGLENGNPDMGLQQEDSRKAGQDSSSTRPGQEGSTKGGKATGFCRRKSSIKGPVPKLFWLSEKPMCSFRGHTEDILDLSWSRTQVVTISHFSISKLMSMGKSRI